MKTLYLTDLDGTLLRPDASLSEYSRDALNRLIERGVIFSFATARSYNTSVPLLDGVNLNAPFIVNNGVYIVRSDQTVVCFDGFPKRESREIFSTFVHHGLFPIVYSEIEGKNRMSFLRKESSAAQVEFALSRKNDRFDPDRVREIFFRSSALDGNVYYFTCIGDEEKLRAAYGELKDRFCCYYQRDLYSGEWWLEVLAKTASKAFAAKRLKSILNCDRLVCFGDGINDVPLFEIADEGYAVENAVPELKRIASRVIAGNREDGVARWLLEHAEI